MSYLDLPRLSFYGRVQIDVSTINNTVQNYDIASFTEQDQTMAGNGGWNPEGTGVFRFVGCRITGAVLPGGRAVGPGGDPVIGMGLGNANDRVPGKLVDLDPQQQMCSEIWGLQLRLADADDGDVFVGDYAPAAFSDLWPRQLHRDLPSDQVLAAAYRSVLTGLRWGDTRGSAVIAALRARSEADRLAVTMNLFGYGRDPASPRYTYATVAGAIGPALAGEPRHFVMGRHLVPPASGARVGQFAATVDEARREVTADFGNCLPVTGAEGELADLGPLYLAIPYQETETVVQEVAQSEIAMLGEVAYRTPGWYRDGAGIQAFAPDAWPAAIADRPLLLVSPIAGDRFAVLAQETLGGLYVQADDRVVRLEPGAMQEVALYASRYGRPLATTITLADTIGTLGLTGSGSGDPPTPQVAQPPHQVAFDKTVTSGPDGRAVLPLTGGRLTPASPRGYIDAQLYGIGYTLPGTPAADAGDRYNFISVLLFSPVEMPKAPTWFRDVQPIMQQYANLYPIMSKRLFRIDDYDTVVENLNLLTFAFALPMTDPNHMPVTRDLSDGARALILTWMTERGPDGKPLKGDPGTAQARSEPLAVLPPVALDLHPIQARGKTAVLLEMAARQSAEMMS